eukprot:9486326-Pyramimonas_sp.AAC.1
MRLRRASSEPRKLPMYPPPPHSYPQLRGAIYVSSGIWSATRKTDPIGRNDPWCSAFGGRVGRNPSAYASAGGP